MKCLAFQALPPTDCIVLLRCCSEKDRGGHVESKGRKRCHCQTESQPIKRVCKGARYADEKRKEGKKEKKKSSQLESENVAELTRGLERGQAHTKI